jgi:hypothetical protein
MILENFYLINMSKITETVSIQIDKGSYILTTKIAINGVALEHSISSVIPDEFVKKHNEMVERAKSKVVEFLDNDVS